VYNSTMKAKRHKLDWFGPRLRQLREERGLTLRQLSEMVGDHLSILSKVERGVIQPSHGLARELRRVFGVEIEPVTVNDDSVQ
jgi:transcriptional regulator with XRE-family HTH domain